MTKAEIISYDRLWDKYRKCRLGVSWKSAVRHYILNAVEETERMCRKLENGTWVDGTPRPIHISYPKPREGQSIPFKDRVYQRSLIDNEIYQSLARSFILDNCACQTGKGPDFALERMKKFLWNFYTHHGRNGTLLQVDIHGYFSSLRKQTVLDSFIDGLSPEILEMAEKVLDAQSPLNDGYHPGSQLIQVAGITVLNRLDHELKEKPHLRYYLRYNDDFWILHEDKAILQAALDRIKARFRELGLEINPKKTRFVPLTETFRFLGFDFRMTETGKILQFINPENVAHERRKLFRAVRLAKEGKLTRKKVDEMYSSWRKHASAGNSYRLLKNMDRYYQGLWR